MRIIEMNEKERIHKCSWCKSKIAYSVKDIEEDWFSRKLIRCPICRKTQRTSIFDKKVKK